MAYKMPSNCVPVQHIQHNRFTTKQHGYQLNDLSLSLSGNIAVCSHNLGRTFIDLYYGGNSDSRDKFKLFYSKEFEINSNENRRYVSFLEKNSSELIVTCNGDKVEIIDTKNESKVLRSCRVKGRTTSLAVRESEIFIGLFQSHTVIVLDNDLKETKKIMLKGIEDNDYPAGLQVINDTLFVCTWCGRLVSIADSNDSIITEYTDTPGTNTRAWCVTVSARLGLVAALWGNNRIIVYSLHDNKWCLVFDIDSREVYRIRISDRDRMIITGDKETGEIKMYDLKQLFSFEAMKRTLAYLTSPDECEKLRTHFRITEDDLSKRVAAYKSQFEYNGQHAKMQCLLNIIEEKGYLYPWNFNNLKDAVSTVGDEMRVSVLKGPMEGYMLHGISATEVKTLQDAWHDERRQLSKRIREITAEHQEETGALNHDLEQVKQKSEDQEQALREKIKSTEQKLKEETTVSTKKIETLTEELKQTKHSLDLSKTESAQQIEILTKDLTRTRTEYVKETETLTEELQQTKQSLDLSKIESAKQVATLTEELKETKKSFDISRAESAKQITTLTEELTHTRTESRKEIETLTEELQKTKQSLDVRKIESAKQIATFTEELEQTKKSFGISRAESAKQIRTLTEELTQTRTESRKEIETLTEELKQTKHSLDLSSTESARELVTISEELERTIQLSDLNRKKFAKQIETLNKELDQTRRESNKEIETLTEEFKKTEESFDLSRTESITKIATLTAELGQTRLESTTETKALQRELERAKHILNKTTEDGDHTRTELKQYQLDFAKESKALKEVLNQTKDAMPELQKRTVEGKSSIDSEVARAEKVSMLAAEFGRLNVEIAEYLTLDHCLKLATLFNVPASDCDMVRRVSFIESPGIKLLDVLKKRNVINMYDVTNLQKGLKMVHLGAVNNDLLVPFQESIDDDQYKLHKAKEMFTWEDVDGFVPTLKEDAGRRQIGNSLISTEDDTEPDKTSQRETRVLSEEKGTLLGDKRHKFYIEQNIGREGGTIRLANVALIIPPDAIYESHVIALTVMNESPFPLDREVDTARMTPLIKLEPLGLMFEKSLQLNIPHSALIPKTEHHDVNIYSGQISKDNEDSSGYVQWTMERSVPRELKEKSVTVGIQRLSYLSASLVSQATVSSFYILRAVLLVDGVRNTVDDITLTICFCSDDNSVYKMLLSDYKTKLPLEQYSTLQLRRNSERGEDDVGFLNVTVSSLNDNYVPYPEGAMKRFNISHLCTASRVSHQLRLQRNQDVDRDVVDIKLKFSQAEYTTNELFLKARIKDLIISQESEDLLTGTLPPAFKPYEELKANISVMLEMHHCSKLATYFELSPAEADKIQTDSAPGRILMKILDEREKIMPGRMIDLFRGLKACHLDKLARIVVEYINETSKETQQDTRQQEERNGKDNASVSQRSSQKLQTRRSQSKKISDTITTVQLSEQTPLKWIEEHRGLIFYLLLMSVDGLLQTQRGVFTLPRWFKN